MTIAYDGREFFGWQRHGDTPTIQHALERGLCAVFGREVEVRGSGRTDRGAHARGQVASAFLPTGIDARTGLAALNDVLPEQIRVLELVAAPEDFHARASAVGKTYRYLIHNAKECPAEVEGRVWHVPEALDVDAMRAALPMFMGTHDFGSFATKAKHERRSNIREITEFALEHEPPAIELWIRADGFLYKMVRNIVRAIVKVGEGRYTVADLRRILAARDRKAAPGTAPASGLYLERVDYA